MGRSKNVTSADTKNRFQKVHDQVAQQGLGDTSAIKYLWLNDGLESGQSGRTCPKLGFAWPNHHRNIRLCLITIHQSNPFATEIIGLALFATLFCSNRGDEPMPSGLS